MDANPTANDLELDIDMLREENLLLQTASRESLRREVYMRRELDVLREQTLELQEQLRDAENEAAFAAECQNRGSFATSPKGTEAAWLASARADSEANCEDHDPTAVVENNHEGAHWHQVQNDDAEKPESTQGAPSVPDSEKEELRRRLQAAADEASAVKEELRSAQEKLHAQNQTAPPLERTKSLPRYFAESTLERKDSLEKVIRRASECHGFNNVQIQDLRGKFDEVEENMAILQDELDKYMEDEGMEDPDGDKWDDTDSTASVLPVQEHLERDLVHKEEMVKYFKAKSMVLQQELTALQGSHVDEADHKRIVQVLQNKLVASELKGKQAAKATVDLVMEVKQLRSTLSKLEEQRPADFLTPSRPWASRHFTEAPNDIIPIDNDNNISNHLLVEAYIKSRKEDQRGCMSSGEALDCVIQ
ncbi:hypothetical protein CYMTET_2975 [Cymbomonas tetramitiformis]|uniref:Uncharacterized protein n=1 Tax=Cymbomonas tetramitiformis TaxID=36881 RepID=A0AAE0H4B9_9CHLO|nr:hypothetical protein CYMTET_2975 [Cymbomonas tetramitiformis]|eukprot:gene7698-9159_t